jgi:DNA invertase Pin-like site-specific DNA recombinase
MNAERNPGLHSNGQQKEDRHESNRPHESRRPRVYRRLPARIDQRQGESGLGLEAQQVAVEAYARHAGAAVAGLYVEVESGKLAARPKLALALAHARRSRATLVVAKLDRLARNVAFLSALMDSSVPFIACDQPQANRLTLHILAAVAEAESVAISQRTKAALAAYKARGGLLGAARPECRHNLTHEARKHGARCAGLAASRAASEAYADLLPVVADRRAAGFTLDAIAKELNDQGHTTRRGRPWNTGQVFRVLQRVAAVP